MSISLEKERCDDLDFGSYTVATVTFGEAGLDTRPMRVWYVPEEKQELGKFLQAILDSQKNKRRVAVFVPPERGDESMAAYGVFGRASSLLRAYFFIISSEPNSSGSFAAAPARVFTDFQETTVGFLQRMQQHLGQNLGRPMRVLPSIVVEQIFGGIPDEFGCDIKKSSSFRVPDILKLPSQETLGEPTVAMARLSMRLNTFFENVERFPGLQGKTWEDYFLVLALNGMYSQFAPKGQGSFVGF